MNTVLLECACSTAEAGFSLLSVLEAFISTFLGFLSALLVNALWERHKSSSLRKQLRKTLIHELQVLKSAVEGLDPSMVYIKPYSTPVWDGASKSGSILCLDKDKEFNDIIRFFSLVDESKMVEITAYEIINSNPRADTQSIMENVREARNQIIDGIEKAIKDLER